MPRRRELPIIPRAELESLHTKSLLARLQLLRECEEEPEVTDLEPEEIAALTGINFKAEPRWREAYTGLKEVLAAREHVPRAAERRLEPIIERAGFEITDANYSDDGMFARYLCRKD